MPRPRSGKPGHCAPRARSQGGPVAAQRHRRHAGHARARVRSTSNNSCASPTSPARCRSRACLAPTVPSRPTSRRCGRTLARWPPPPTCAASSATRPSPPRIATPATPSRTPTRCAAIRKSPAPRAIRSPSPARSPAASWARPSTTRPSWATSRIESNGNFHGEILAFACDFLAIAASEVGAIAERRVDRLLDPNRSQGLPAFLAPEPGVNSGLMLAQYTAAALVAENKRLAVPASVDSLPTSGMQEDHVSMGFGARAQAAPGTRQSRPHLRCRSSSARRTRSTCARRWRRRPERPPSCAWCGRGPWPGPGSRGRADARGRRRHGPRWPRAETFSKLLEQLSNDSYKP